MICHFCNKILSKDPCELERFYGEDEFICQVCREQIHNEASAEYGRQLRKRQMEQVNRQQVEQLSLFKEV